MNSAEIDIANLLNGVSSLGLTLATDLFFSRFPDDPSNCVTVIDNPGAPPRLALLQSESGYYYSSVSVRVRNKSYEAGFDQMFAIMDYLHATGNFVVDTAYYSLVRAMNDPQVLHWDKNDRVVFFVNFEVQRRNN